ncbi:MAG: hypothetical protein WDN44_09605 [Sphingomonas sp.]
MIVIAGAGAVSCAIAGAVEASMSAPKLIIEKRIVFLSIKPMVPACCRRCRSLGAKAPARLSSAQEHCRITLRRTTIFAELLQETERVLRYRNS